MKNICHFLGLMMMIALTVGVAVAQNNFESLKGGETPKFQSNTETAKCVVYGKYVVKTKAGEDVGENISVFQNKASVTAKNACKEKLSGLVTIKNTDSNYFYGLFESFMFIDSGTSASARGLEVYSLDSKKSLFNFNYVGEAKILPGKILSFDQISEKAGSIKTCKQAAQIKRDGMTVGWMQTTKLDLNTLKTSTVGGLRCFAQE